jgi:hypothetical protein
MPNPHPNTLGLKKPKWKHTPTTPIRVPAVFAPQLLELARFLDELGTLPDYSKMQQEIFELKLENARLSYQVERLSNRTE